MRNNILDTLFPRTRQAILAALLLSPERRWYLSDLAQHLGVTPSSLQRELAALTQAGILLREANGNRVYYQANTASPILPELQSLFTKTVGASEKIREALEPFGDKIDLAFIFGSAARGEQTANSDIDLLIVGDVEIAGLALPLREVERAIHIPINTIHYAPAEFRGKQQGNHFLQTVLSGPKILLKGSTYELENTFNESKTQSTYNKQART